jgi:hypothetical protein
LVVGRRCAAAADFVDFLDFVDFVARGFFAAAADDFFLFERFFAGAVAVPVVAATPDETRVECLGRCLTNFFGAASAADATVKAASSATNNRFIVLRIIAALLRGGYDTSRRRLCYGFF